jgi:hypothetical protein
VTVSLLALAGFLALLALLAWQVRAPAPHAGSPRVVVLRRIYMTTEIETVTGARAGGGTSVTQSVSSSGPAGTSPAPPATRSSA